MKLNFLLSSAPFIVLALAGNACAPSANGVGADTAAQSPVRPDVATNGVEFLSTGGCRAVVTPVLKDKPGAGIDVIYDPSCTSTDRRTVLKSSRIAKTFFVNGIPSPADDGGAGNISRWTCTGMGDNGFEHITAHSMQELNEKQQSAGQRIGPNTRWTTPEECPTPGASGVIPG